MSDTRRAVTNQSLTIGVMIVIGLALLIVPLVVDLGNYILTLLVSLLIFIALGESWNLMGGYAGQVNLGLCVTCWSMWKEYRSTWL
jgi:ABC-type branched-subunit amino acid transport system permease subunit